MTQLDLIGSCNLQDLPEFLVTNQVEVIGQVCPEPPKQDDRGNGYGPGLGMIPDPKGRKNPDGSPFMVYAIVVKKLDGC